MSGRDRPAIRREGRVVAGHGRDAIVEDDAGHRIHCRLAGRKLAVVCGDRIRWLPGRTEGGAGVIVESLPRKTLLARLTLRGTAEPIAANLTQLVAVVSPEPAPDFGLCDRYLAAAAWSRLEACIVANKCDLEFPSVMKAALDEFRRLGYVVIPASRHADAGIASLQERLVGATSVLVGQSGVGKSSLTNRLVPGVEASVAAVTRATASGRHTTTASSLHPLPGGGELVDSPGVRDFSPPLPPAREIAGGFREIAALAPDCRFRDCLHLREPGCAVSAACDEGRVAPRRLASYRGLLRLAGRFAARDVPRIRR